MASRVEEVLAQRLRAALARAEPGEALDQFEEFQKALVALDWFLPGILARFTDTGKAVASTASWNTAARRSDPPAPRCSG